MLVVPTYDLSTTEAAAILGVHPDTLKLWAKRNLIPSWRTPGGHRRFNRADLERFQQPEPSEAS